MDLEVIDGMYLLSSVSADPGELDLPDEAFERDGLSVVTAGDFVAVFLANDDAEDLTLTVVLWDEMEDLDKYSHPDFWPHRAVGSVSVRDALEIRTLEHAPVERITEGGGDFGFMLVERIAPSKELRRGEPLIQQNLFVWPLG